ncbi:MAG: SDR family NAD(P)-dependent oxidoreductase [Desulfitobacterium sp.]
MKDLQFSDKVVIVTGGGMGIGKAIAVAFAREGAKVMIADWNLEAAEATVKEISDNGGVTEAIKVNVANSADVKLMVDTTIEKWGTVDILINNAGISTGPIMIEDMSEEDWRRVIDVDLTGIFLCCKAVIPVMKGNSYGKIINMSSNAAKRISFNGSGNYTAAKEGVLGFTRQLAYELAPYGINVNSVCPGATMTPLLERIATPETLKERLTYIPRGKFCSSEDMADACLFLASDNADMICGVALDVDGGGLLGWMSNDKYEQKRKKK